MGKHKIDIQTYNLGIAELGLGGESQRALLGPRFDSQHSEQTTTTSHSSSNASEASSGLQIYCTHVVQTHKQAKHP